MGNAKIARRKRRLRKLRRIALSLVGVILVGWVFYLGATWGPRSPDSAALEVTDSGSRQMVEESEELAKKFEAVASYRDPNAEELDLLDQAIVLQRNYNSAGRPGPEDYRRLKELEARMDHFLAKESHARSVTAEEESVRLFEEGKGLEAVALLREAYELQRKVNQQYGRSDFRDAFRESRLEQELASSEAAPLHERSVELEADADEAVGDFRWAEARRFLNEAVELQKQVNQTSRRSAFYNTSRVTQLEQKIASLEVGEMMTEVQEFEARGRDYETKSQWERAAQEYERAMILQNQINRDHPQSPFVSVEKVMELDEARQTALGTPEGRRLETALTGLREGLRQGDFGAVRAQVESARTILGRLSERFPRSSFVNAEVRRELEFLSAAAPAVPEMQELLQEGLLPLPGQAGWEMSATPVSQLLYSRVMNTNPSRHLGEDLPVDSITYRQAQEFCLRASWVLARPVQLPAKAQFEAALGEWEPASYSVLSWHSGNSEGVSHPVSTGAANANGFYHLVGNLRTWLLDGGENGSAWTAGASYADEFPEENLFQTISSTERARTVGFRYVVGGAES